jgi:hypothetical protein
MIEVCMMCFGKKFLALEVEGDLSALTEILFFGVIDNQKS